MVGVLVVYTRLPSLYNDKLLWIFFYISLQKVMVAKGLRPNPQSCGKTMV